jgi:hypothetical protein
MRMAAKKVGEVLWDGDALPSFGLAPDEKEQLLSVLRRIPADKYALYYGASNVAWWANRIDEQAPAKGTENSLPRTEIGLTYWRAGMAGRFLAALDSFADSFFGGNQDSAIKAVAAISAWFKKNEAGEGLFAPLEKTVARAAAMNNAGLALHEAEARLSVAAKKK